MRRHFIIIIAVIAAVALAAIQAADEPNKASKQQHQMGKAIPGKKLTPAEKEARRAARQKFVDEVNAKAKGKGWTAKLHGKFAELDDDVIVKMQGSVDPSDVKHAQESGGKHAYDVPKPKSEPTRAEYKAMMKEVGKVDPALFASGSRAKRQAGVTCTDSRFDVRDKWPQCADIINNVRDQSLCGSCWAVSSASAYSDRHCIEMVKQGKTPPAADAENAFYSAADVMQCSGGKAGDDACSGGNTAAAWQWYTETGGVTGGNYSMGGCIPYPFPTSTAASAEGIQSYTDTDACPTSCSNADYSNEYSSDKAMASSYNALYATNTGNQWAMVNELQNNGTITASFVVYSDFEHYSTGIYTHVTGVSRGGHAIRLIGFGTVECTDGTSTDYWLGVNSWNTDWGQNGLFQIKRGSDECSIESRRISWGTPTV